MSHIHSFYNNGSLSVRPMDYLRQNHQGPLSRVLSGELKFLGSGAQNLHFFFKELCWGFFQTLKFENHSSITSYPCNFPPFSSASLLAFFLPCLPPSTYYNLHSRHGVECQWCTRRRAKAASGCSKETQMEMPVSSST